MKFNSKLWMLAVAMATVGCSDDIENGPNNGNGNGEEGPQTYMKVSLNTETVTKAPVGDTGKPSGGEDGDDEEPYTEATAKEFDVNDVTVILFRNADNSPVDPINSNSVLVASGFANGISDPVASGEPNHSRMTTVTLNVTNEAENFDGQTYGVIAVTNLGAKTVLADRIKSGDIDSGADLANYLQKTVETSGDNFVMSSHFPTVETVTLEAGATEADAPETNLHVERLAAKVRINEYKTGDPATGNQFVYTITEGSDAVAKVRLEQVAIVNKLNSGTYLLKRVSSTASDLTAIPDVSGDVYLANEIWSSGTSANYVIDPWTRAKNEASATSVNTIAAATGITMPTEETQSTLSYANSFSGDSYDAMWNGLSDKKNLAYGEDETFTSPLHLTYTQENTISAANTASLKAYGTGAIFKAIYVPAKVSAIGTADQADQIVAEDFSAYADFDADATTNADNTFYVYQNVAYDAPLTIWAEYVWKHQTTTEEREAVDYDDFNSTSIESLSKDAFMKSDLANAAGDPFGYVAYLKEKAGDATNGSWTGNFTTADAFETYIASDNGKAAMNESVKTYTNGECYYPYWIRHANNNKANEMGIMEFAIVRNNIYDLTVESISGFGLSGTDKPDPTTPIEEDSFFMKVNLFVRNWVVRSNSGIIL